MDKLHWSVDSLIFRNGTYFGFGWIFHEEKEIQELKLVVRLANGLIQYINAEIGKPRGDLAKHFSQFDGALHSGIVLLGSVQQTEYVSGDLSLLGSFSDGLSFEVHIPESHVISLDLKPHSNKYVFARQLQMMIKRALLLIKSGQFDLLKEKILRQLRRNNEIVVVKSDKIEDNLSKQERQSVALIVDHDLGGGANYYRDRLVNERIASGATVFILSYHVPTLSMILVIRNSTRDERLIIPGYDFIFDLASKIDFQEIIYNTGVSFSNPEGIPALLLALKRKYNLRLTLLVHDFFMVCPSHFLLDDRGNYCGVPNIKRCQNCLVKNQSGFATLFQARDINQWRSLWNAVFEVADQIITFSENTLSILKKAYPTIPLNLVSVEPHSLQHLKTERVVPTFSETLKIGVVGQIGYHKGAKFVQGLAREIAERKLKIQIVIIGEIEVKCDSSVVSQTGKYQPDQLSTLIRLEGVNIMLFPSICPETFSYVVHELINLELPVACFDMGAPADRLAMYSKGLILKISDPPLVLDQLISFHQRMYFLN